MILSNSVFNFFNRNAVVLQHQETRNIITTSFCKKSKLLTAVPVIHWDSLNFSYSNMFLKKTNQKKLFLKFFYNCFIFQWARVNYRGKSFRVRNFCNNNKFTMNFGYSHWTKLKLLQNWAFFKKKRQHFIVYTFTLKDFNYFLRFWPHIRFYNCYTMRGLRLKKQPIIRRFGKISQHISSLH